MFGALNFETDAFPPVRHVVEHNSMFARSSPRRQFSAPFSLGGTFIFGQMQRRLYHSL